MFSSADMYIIPQICCIFPIWPFYIYYSLYTKTCRMLRCHCCLTAISDWSLSAQTQSKKISSIHRKFTSYKVFTRTWCVYFCTTDRSCLCLFSTFCESWAQAGCKEGAFWDMEATPTTHKFLKWKAVYCEASNASFFSLSSSRLLSTRQACLTLEIVHVVVSQFV